ncbi:hypothetical protein DM02DRAFT_537848, partial [Periconia macrospinosa]
SSLTFKGPVTPGGPEVTLSGTAEEIYAKVLEINPSYDPWAFPDFRANQAAKGVTKAAWGASFTNGSMGTDKNITSRDTGLKKRAETNCSWGAWVSASCAMVACEHTCGTSLCNNNDFSIHVDCQDIATDMTRILKECGQEVFGGRLTRVRGALDFGDHYTAVGQC